MISKLEDGTVFLKMGDGTLFSSVVLTKEGDPIGICFSNSADKLEDGVIFQITSMAGLAGFMRPLVNLFDRWNTENNEMASKEIKELRDTIEPFLPIKAKLD